MRRKERKTAAAVRDWTAQYAENLPYLEMRGNREMIIDGCSGVLEYTQNGIVLYAGRYVLRFAGEDLTMQSYAEHQTQIAGRIQSIVFEENGGKVC